MLGDQNSLSIMIYSKKTSMVYSENHLYVRIKSNFYFKPKGLMSEPGFYPSPHPILFASYILATWATSCATHTSLLCLPLSPYSSFNLCFNIIHGVKQALILCLPCKCPCMSVIIMDILKNLRIRNVIPIFKEFLM